MGKEEYRIHINKLVGSIESERVLKLIYEIAKRFFLNEYLELVLLEEEEEYERSNQSII